MPRPSRHEIANAALSEIAGGVLDTWREALANLMASNLGLDDPEDDLAVLVSNVYAREKRAALAYPWPFARKRTQLTPHPDGPPDPASGFTYAYALPDDMLTSAPRGLYPTEFSTTPIPGGWKIMGLKMGSIHSPMWAEYSHEVQEGLWPPLFVRAFILLLCWRIAYPLTDSVALRESYREAAVLAMQDAQANEGQNESDDESSIGHIPIIPFRQGGLGSLDDFGTVSVQPQYHVQAKTIELADGRLVRPGPGGYVVATDGTVTPIEQGQFFCLDGPGSIKNAGEHCSSVAGG